MERRHFFATSLAAAIARPAAAADKVTVALIGVRGRGRALTSDFCALSDVNVAYLCDVDSEAPAKALAIVERSGRPRPKVVSDLRRVLDDRTVDAVVVATPDHWHAPATLLACAAGKDVYVEKPCAHNFREGRLMVEAARKHNRIVQVGTQARSRPSTIEGIEYVRSGKIGRPLAAKAFNIQLRENIGRKPDSAVPAGVDFDTWTGPAPVLPFNENRFHYTWHWHWNYGTGDMGNDGVHQLDQARWALDVDLPTRVSGLATKLFFDDDQQTPDTMNIAFDYGSKMLTFEMRIWNPYGIEGDENIVQVYGPGGYVQLHSQGRILAFDEKGKVVHEIKPTPDLHARNFIDCVRSRKAPNADIAIGHASTALCHLGNIVARTGRQVAFDPSTGSITDKEQSKLLSRNYRAHWATPAGA